MRHEMSIGYLIGTLSAELDSTNDKLQSYRTNIRRLHGFIDELTIELKQAVEQNHDAMEATINDILGHVTNNKPELPYDMRRDNY